jgi:O-acetyl-ADP-ribose deacetylase (regulator of RNase III)
VEAALQVRAAPNHGTWTCLLLSLKGIDGVTERLDFSFNLVQTALRVIYADITRLDVDAVVSTDDVHLSRVEPNGVATAIRAAAGNVPHDDARKHLLPIPVGSVIITGAGRLSAKYIFHTTTFEYNARPNPDILIPQVVGRIMEIAATLRVERLAMPVLLSGRSGVSKATVVTCMLRSAACFLVAQTHTLRELTIAIYTGGVADHVRAEQKRIEELAPVREQIAGWAAEVAPLNTRLALLQPLLGAIAGDAELEHMLDARLNADRRALRQVFDCPETVGATAEQVSDDNHEAAPRNRQEYDFARRKLESLLQDLTEEADHLSEVRRAEKRRMHSLERQRAHHGNDTSPQVITEIEDICRNLEQRDRQIQQLHEQRQAAQSDLDMLERRWQLRHEA